MLLPHRGCQAVSCCVLLIVCTVWWLRDWCCCNHTGIHAVDSGYHCVTTAWLLMLSHWGCPTDVCVACCPNCMATAWLMLLQPHRDPRIGQRVPLRDNCVTADAVSLGLITLVWTVYTVFRVSLSWREYRNDLFSLECCGPCISRLTHWGRVTHICVSKLTIIGPDNGLSPGRRQAIIWTNDGILLIGPLGTNFSEILIEIYIFSFKKMHLKMSSGNW